MATLVQFDTAKVSKELKKICKSSNIPTTAIELILNNMNMYNTILELFEQGDTKKVYLLYQMNGQIFNQLKEFKLTPNKKDNGSAEESSNLDDILKKKK